MKIRKQSKEQIRKRMEDNPHTYSRWYQDCVQELSRREKLQKVPKPRTVKHHRHIPIASEMVTIRECDETLARLHKGKQKQSSLTLSPRKKVSSW